MTGTVPGVGITGMDYRLGPQRAYVSMRRGRETVILLLKVIVSMFPPW